MGIRVPLVGSNEFALISDKDEWALRFNWTITEQGYAIRTARLARDIMNADRFPGLQVDHINRNRLDNRRKNLRFATPAQNSHNRGMRSDNESGHVGVHWRKGLGKWIARASEYGVRHHLGAYETHEEACEAVQEFRREAMERGGVVLEKRSNT